MQKNYLLLGQKIYSVNRSKVSTRFIVKNYKLSDVKKIINNFDIVINALPLTTTTKNFFNAKIFKNMKKNSYFINISRDQTIDVKDFKKILKKEKICWSGYR